MPDGSGSLGSLLWMLFSVLLIILLAYLFTRFVVGRSRLARGPVGKNNALQAVARMNVGRDAQLLLVKAGEKYLLLGVTAGKISTLAEFSPEEAKAFLAEEEPPQDGQPPTFLEALKKSIKEVKHR